MNDIFTTCGYNPYSYKLCCTESGTSTEYNQVSGYAVYANGNIVRANVPDGELPNYGNKQTIRL